MLAPSLWPLLFGLILVRTSRTGNRSFPIPWQVSISFWLSPRPLRLGWLSLLAGLACLWYNERMRRADRHSQPLLAYRLKSENVDELDQLLSARRGLSRSVSRLKLQAASLPKAQTALLPAIEALCKELKLLDKRIAAIVKTQPEFAMAAKLQKVTGIGPVSAAAIASRLTAKQFVHPDQFVAYVGLDVGVRQSGMRKGNTGLTKQGDAELRRLLYMCAQATLRNKDNPFAERYKKERARGMATTAALCVVARKLAHVCWSMHKYETDYDPERVGKPPAKERDPKERDREDRATLGSDPSARSGATPPEASRPT